MGEGQMQAYYADIARTLKEDGYQGTISLESVYAPENGVREDRFRKSLPVFKQLLSCGKRCHEFGDRCQKR